jgi:ABC-2 type transport system ATP-binding protein
VTQTDCLREAVIQVSNISKTFGRVKALDKVSLTVYRNEIFGLLGPNGSGKTTLLRILATLIHPDSRSPKGGHKVNCSIAGHDIFSEGDKIRRVIGYVPQRDSLYSDLSAQDNLIFFSTPYALKEKRKHVVQLLQMAGLYDRRNSLVSTFSGGMMKRLSVMCALVHEPSVIIFDEATVGLDQEIRREIWNLIKELKQGRAVIVTTHYIDEAEAHCDRVALLFDGKVLDVGTPAELLAKYPPARSLEEAVGIIQRQHIGEQLVGPRMV